MSFAACTEPSAPEPTPDTPALTTVAVAVVAPMLTVGQTTQATASGVDQNNAPIATGAVTWSSTANASISADGIVTAVSPGTATILADAGGKRGQTMVTIMARPATALLVSAVPSATSASRAALGVQPSVRLLNSVGGFVLQAGVTVTVATSAGTIVGANTAITDANGIATFAGLGLSGTAGARTLTFTAPGLAATTANVALTAGAPTSVIINGGNQQTVAAGASVPIAPSVLVTDADANVVSGAQVDFTITAGAGTLTGASVTTNADGIATLGSWTLGTPGLNTLQAKVSGEGAAVALTAMATQAPALAVINVTLAQSTLQAGKTTQVTAAGVDQYGANIATGAITWSSSNPNATVTASGVVTAIAAGPATITASAGGKNGQAIITVTPAPVAPVVTTLSISIAPTSIQIGQTAQAAVTALDQFGASIATGPVMWSATGGATINASGIVSALSAGQAQITVVASGKSAQTTITITAPPSTPVLSSLTISINPTTIQVGQTAQVSVSGRDQFGLSLPPGPITWLATAGVSISANGVVTGTSAGTATITANAGGFSVQQDLVVTAVPGNRVLTSMTITFSATSIQIGQTSQAAVTGFDQFGVAMPTGSISWTVSGNSTISSSGLITGTQTGPVHVVAIAGTVAIAGDIAVVVAPPTTTPVLTSIVVTLSPSVVISGEQSQATAQGYDQYGAPISTGTVTWSFPSYTSFMTITPAGLISTIPQYAGGSGGMLPITATVGTVKATANLTIRMVAKIGVTFAKPVALVGEAVDVTLAALDQYDNPISSPLGVTECPGGCSATATYVRNSNNSLTVTGTSVGTYALRVFSPAGPVNTYVIGNGSFKIVKPPELTALVVSWPTNLQVGQTVNIAVAGRDQFGNPFPLGSVSYYADPTYLATIDQFGALTVLRPGSFTVTVVGKRANGADMPSAHVFTVTGTPTARIEVTTQPTSPIFNRVQIAYQEPVSVQVVDIASGQPVSWFGLPVTAALTSGGGTLTGNTMLKTTSAGFESFTYWTFSGPAGPKTVTFTAPGVSPATWQFVLQAGAASAISINAGNNQSTVNGTAVAIKPTVKVTDRDGNAVSGATVVFTVLAGGGSVTGASVTTDSNGLAQAGSWTLGPGSNTLKAQAAGVGSTVTFAATGTP